MRSAKVALRAHGSRFARFSIIGAIAGAADFTVYLSLVAFGAPPVVANFPAFVASTVTSYNLNARITFRRNGAPAPVSLSGYARYFSAYVFSLIVSTAIIGFFAGPIGAVPAKIAAIPIAAVCNYLASHFLVFGRHAENEGAGAGPESA